MQIIADLHIHSRFSRACSKEITIDNLEKYARIKGLNLLGTGDFQHPKWIQELKSKLTEDDKGILRTKTGFPFLWQTEISLMYTKNNKGRKIHNVILAPNGEVVKQITDALLKKGRIDYDGRPIFGFTSEELVDMLISISDKCIIIPAHTWTPYFGIFGSMSGFDSVEECFGDKSKYIYALETGMSADPAMIWRLSKLDKYSVVSFSDMHSFWPWRIGREATIFDIELSYNNIFKAIKDKKGLAGTIETDPGYGKYHFDGHRNCNVCMNPSETVKNKGICPKCGKKLTIGVLHRVDELADRPEGFVPKNALPFKKLIPLSELIANIYDLGITTKRVWEIYNKLIKEFSSEINVMLNADEGALKKIVHPLLAEAIINNRKGKIEVNPGFDGNYGIPVFKNKIKPQKSLADFQSSSGKNS